VVVDEEEAVEAVAFPPAMPPNIELPAAPQPANRIVAAKAAIVVVIFFIVYDLYKFGTNVQNNFEIFS